MLITKAIKLHLLADEDVAAIVGARVFLRRAPQKASYPRIVVSMASAEWPTRSQADRADATKHVVKARIQVDCYCKGATAEDDVDTLAETVSESLDDFRGTTQGVVVSRSLQDDERDNYEPLQDGSDDGVHRITQDYGIHYRQPTTV